MQHRAIRLMASKLAVAGIIEGSNFTDEGLAAMSDVTDLTSALARELSQGIEGTVEDLSDVFKKMAILKTEGFQQVSDEIVQDSDIIDVEAIEVTSEPEIFTEIPAPRPASGLLSMLASSPTPVKPKKKKVVAVDPNQLTLFDVFDVKAG